MIRSVANKLVSYIPKESLDNYTLTCLWIAITENQILTLFPEHEKALAVLVARVLDADLLTEEHVMASKQDEQSTNPTIP